VTAAHRTLLIAGALSGLLACDDVVPQVGALQTGACDPRDSNPDQEISFTRHLLPVMTRPLGMGGCSCHLPQSAVSIGVELGGVNASSYDSLRRGGVNSGTRIIVPGDPCASIIVQKVSETPPFGSRMPLDGPPFLNAAERQALHDWIAEGAQNN
jgi:hypothetical protein